MWPGQTQQSLANRSIVVLRGMTSVPLSQLPPADDRRNWDAYVSQVGRHQTMKALECDHNQPDVVIKPATFERRP